MLFRGFQSVNITISVGTKMFEKTSTMDTNSDVRATVMCTPRTRALRRVLIPNGYLTNFVIDSYSRIGWTTSKVQ